jgi:hypothetical protein
VHDTDQITEKAALREVQDRVEDSWLSDWQPVSSANDDSIDGIILFRRKRRKSKRKGFHGNLTGALAFVQVKGGRGYRTEAQSRPAHFGINLGRQYINDHRPRWARLAGPVILGWVDTESPGREAWWGDLNDEASYCEENKQIVLLHKGRRFGEHSKGEIAGLWGTLVRDSENPRLRLTRSDVNCATLTESPKHAARRYYQAWATAPADARTHTALGEVIVSRVGWRHITRDGRRRERVMQSFQLLPAAKAMVLGVARFVQLAAATVRSGPDGTRVVCDYVGLRAFVEFPHRHESVVQVILRRVRTLGGEAVLKQSVWFYSVYELRRGANAHPLKGR